MEEKAAIWKLTDQVDLEFEILLPLQPDIPGFALRLYEVIQTLELVENRSAYQIIGDLITDVRNIQIQGMITQIEINNDRLIVTGWINEPGIFELLSQIALTDPFVRKYDWQDNPRKTALEAILNNYADCPADTLRERSEVVEILHDRSINDSDEQLREFAQPKLTEWESK